MVYDWFNVHNGLASATRLPSLSRPHARLSTLELLLLLSCGGTAALALAFVKLRLGIPGHSIVLTALPMVFGLSIAPRRLAGTIMSAGAFGTAWMLVAFGGVSYGSGAFVSLTVLGPAMDIALYRARSGTLVYVSLVMAGVAANLLALGSRAAAKLLGLDLAGARSFDSWWLQALFTYTASGIVAGLIGALCWFHFGDRSRPHQTES